MKIVCFCVDTQRDFMDKNGKLAVPNTDTIRRNLADLTKLADDNEIMVVNTADWHNNETQEISKTPNFITQFPEHCMENTIGADFIAETSPSGLPLVGTIFSWDKKYTQAKIEAMVEDFRNIVITKDKFDVFEGNPHTEAIVKAIAPDLVIAYGVVSQVCVNFAMHGLVKRGYKVGVVVDAIKELPNIPLEAVVKYWVDNNVAFYSVGNELKGHAVADILATLNIPVKNIKEII